MANKNTLMTALLFTNQDDFAATFFPPSTFEVLQLDQFKAAKKAIRSKSPSLVIGDLRNQSQLHDFQQLASYTKEQLQYRECQFLAVVDSSYQSSDYSNDSTPAKSSIYTTLTDNPCIDEIFDTADTSPTKFCQRVLKITQFISAMSLAVKQSDAQASLLMSVTRFSHHRQPVEQLIRCVAEALSEFCNAHNSCIVYNDSIEIHSQNVHDGYVPIDPPAWLASTIEQARGCSSPKIELLEESHDTKQLTEALQESIGSYILFPLRVYGENLASIVCFIGENAMHLVSTQHLNVMRDVADQLRLVLEQRSAENRLEAQYQRLKSTMSELQTTKEQLVHSEKMASVGKIAAGLAHEINNPLSFVLGNFDPLNEYVDTLVKMLTLHDRFMTAISPNSDNVALRDQINEFKADTELDYVVEDIQAIVNDSRDGLLRVRDIINDLSSFSHKQGLETQNVHIIEVIEEALRLLKYEIPADIHIENRIDKALTLNSHRGFIQQIITNLVKNAAQALNATSHVTAISKSIKIFSQQNASQLQIVVEDNGPGIPESQLSKVFDPFFTTKEIGKGTGLGLSVCFNLAKKMGGELTVESEKQQLTRFTLALPLTA